VFGMGTGVTLSTKSPENREEIRGQISEVRYPICDLKISKKVSENRIVTDKAI
jgi:hypothetical protein